MNDITVIVSTLGREDNVKKVINNLEEQNLPLDLVIINASKVKLSKEYFDKALMYSSIINFNIIEEPGCSLALARKLGVNKSNSSYVCFVDDDIELPSNYLLTAKLFLDEQVGYDGVGGIYDDEITKNRNFIKRAISRVFGLTGNCFSNMVKRNSWPDKPLGDYKNIDTDARWLYGCNGVFRRKIFSNNIIETSLHGWSFLEDVIMGYRACELFGSKFKLLNSLRVHHSGDESSGAISPETIKMRILYRYIFWKEINTTPNLIDKSLFNWSMLGNLILMQKQSFTLNTIKYVYLSHRYIMMNKDIDWNEANEFILKEN